MRVLTFILSHSIFVALCAVALTYQTTLLLFLSADIFLYGFIFFATLCSYNFYWLLSKYALRPGFLPAGFIRDEMPEIIFLFISAAGMVFFFMNGSLPSATVLVSVLLTVAYALPLLPFRILQFTRKAGVLKTILLAFTWTYVTAFIPMQKLNLHFTDAELFILTRRFLFMLMLCIIFDSRDIAVDKIRGLRSLATDLRPALLKWLIIAIFGILFLSNFLSPRYGISIRQSIALQVSTIALLITYHFSTRRQGYLFYYFIVDGMMLFSALATYIASI